MFLKEVKMKKVKKPKYDWSSINCLPVRPTIYQRIEELLKDVVRPSVVPRTATEAMIMHENDFWSEGEFERIRRLQADMDEVWSTNYQYVRFLKGFDISEEVLK